MGRLLHCHRQWWMAAKPARRRVHCELEAVWVQKARRATSGIGDGRTSPSRSVRLQEVCANGVKRTQHEPMSLGRPPAKPIQD